MVAYIAVQSGGRSTLAYTCANSVHCLPLSASSSHPRYTHRHNFPLAHPAQCTAAHLGMTYRQLFSGVAGVRGTHMVAYIAVPSGLKVAGESSGCRSRWGENPTPPWLGSTSLWERGTERSAKTVCTQLHRDTAQSSHESSAAV